MKTAYADPIAQAAIDRLEAENAELDDRYVALAAAFNGQEIESVARLMRAEQMEAKAERLSSLVATYELDQQEDETLIAELRAKVAAVEALAEAMSVSCHYMLAVEAPERIRAALRQAKP